MRTDQIYSSLLFSVCLHSLFVIATVIYVMYSGEHYKVAPFVVSLVDTSSNNSSPGPVQKSIEVPAPQQEKSVHTTEKNEKVTLKEKSDVNERIAALEAKKKIETVARLRKSVDIFAAKRSAGSKAQTSGIATPGGADYISLIGTKIRENFHVPESMDKDLLAIINIRISKNGSVAILGFEKKSGNPLYDRAAIKAINDAAPFPPPPAEMEISPRLHPPER